MSEPTFNGKELQSLAQGFAEFRGEMKARFDALERNLDDFKKEVRNDLDRGQEKFDSLDERLRAVPDNTKHIQMLEDRVTRIEETGGPGGISGEQVKSVLLRYVLPYGGIAGGTTALHQLVGAG